MLSTFLPILQTDLFETTEIQIYFYFIPFRQKVRCYSHGMCLERVRISSLQLYVDGNCSVYASVPQRFLLLSDIQVSLWKLILLRMELYQIPTKVFKVRSCESFAASLQIISLYINFPSMMIRCSSRRKEHNFVFRLAFYILFVYTWKRW